MTTQHTDLRSPPTVMRTRDLDPDGLAFWGVVSGTWTLERAHNFLSDCHGLNLMLSRMRAALSETLHLLAERGVLDDRTDQPPFDADRRCRQCGVIHAEAPVLQRSGASCFRNLWGAVPLNTAGLRSGGRR